MIKVSLEYDRRIVEVAKVFDEIAEGFKHTRTRIWPSTKSFYEKYIKGRKGVLLDLGCGTGRNTIYFASKGLKVISVDISLKMLKIAREEVKRKLPWSQVELVQAEVTKLPFKENIFDFIVAVAVIHHIPYREMRIKMLKEARRVLKKNGIIYVTAWSLANIRRILRALKGKILNPFKVEFGDTYIAWHTRGKTYQRYYHLYTLKELKEDLRRAGFRIVEAYKEFRRKLFFYENAVVIGIKE